MDKAEWVMIVAANSLTLGRLLAGLAFPLINVAWRPAVVLAAAASDGIDGAVSRRFHAASSGGRLLDPIADKIFVLMVVATLWSEGTLLIWQIALVGMRDWVVLFVGIWLVLSRNWGGLSRMAPRWSGKLATGAQFLFLLAVLYGANKLDVFFVITAILSSVAALHYLIITYESIRTVKPAGN